MARRTNATEVEREIRRQLAAGLASNDTVVINDIACYPPSASRATWRTKQHIDGRPYERSGGRTIDTVYAAYLAQMEIQASELVRAEDHPQHDRRSVTDFVEAYLAEGGKKGNWQEHTARDRRRDFRALLELGKNLACADLSSGHIERFLTRGAATQGRATTLLNITGTLLR